MRLRLVSVLIASLLTVTSLSPIEAAQRPREGAWNGFATATVAGRLHASAPTLGAPTTTKPPQPDGCRLAIYVGPNPMPAQPFPWDLRVVRFYESMPGYPPDICRLRRGWFLVITGSIEAWLCETNACRLEQNVVGRTIEVRQ